MDRSELVEKTEQLEKNLAKLINAYQEQTGLLVRDVVIRPELGFMKFGIIGDGVYPSKEVFSARSKIVESIVVQVAVVL